MKLSEENKIKEIISHIKRGGNAELVSTKQRRYILTELDPTSIWKGEITMINFINLGGGVWLAYLIETNTGNVISSIPKHIRKLVKKDLDELLST